MSDDGGIEGARGEGGEDDPGLPIAVDASCNHPKDVTGHVCVPWVISDGRGTVRARRITGANAGRGTPHQLSLLDATLVARAFVCLSHISSSLHMPRTQ